MQTRNIKLRALEPEDVDLIYRWENDPEMWDCSAEHAPFSRHRLMDYVMNDGLRDICASRQLRLVAMDGEVAVGCVDLYDYEPFHQRAGVGMLVDARLRGRGYGKAMLMALTEYCRRHLLLHQLYCEVAVGNVASRRLFEGCGFVDAGCRKQWLRRPDGWEDACVYQLILE